MSLTSDFFWRNFLKFKSWFLKKKSILNSIIKTPILISTHTWTKKMPTFPSPNLWQWLIFIQAKAGLSWSCFAGLNNKSLNKMTTHPLQSILHKLSDRWIGLLSSPNVNESCQQAARDLFFAYFLLVVCFCFFFGLCLLMLSLALYFWWMGSHPWFFIYRVFLLIRTDWKWAELWAQLALDWLSFFHPVPSKHGSNLTCNYNSLLYLLRVACAPHYRWWSGHFIHLLAGSQIFQIISFCI